MPNRQRHAICSIVLTLVLMVTLAFSAFGQVRSHTAAEARLSPVQAMAELTKSSVAQEHAHDVDDIGEKSQRHPVSHNPSDHTHDVPANPGRVEVASRLFDRQWAISRRAPAVVNDGDRLERPPRA